MNATLLKGKLRFLGWLNRPWALEQPDGSSIDLWPLIQPVLIALHGKPASHDYERNAYELRAEPSSDFDLLYDTGEHGDMANPVLKKRAEFGFSNTGIYIARSLQRINGRQVIVWIGADRIRIEADSSEAVHGVKFFGSGNSCQIVNGDETRVCGLGTDKCCVFLAHGGGPTFECLKFSGSMADHLLDRIAKEDIRARRIGSCECTGRSPEPGEVAA